MIIKHRDEPVDLKLLRYLDLRMNVSEKEKKKLFEP